MAGLKYWTARLFWYGIIADGPAESGGDADENPDTKGINGGVTITATIARRSSQAVRAQDLTPHPALLALAPFEVRLDAGQLKRTASQADVRLVAKSSVLDLPDDVTIWYTFRPHHITYNGQPQQLPEFTVPAPLVADDHDDDTDGEVVVDLAIAEWIENAVTIGSDVFIRQVPDDVRLNGDDQLVFSSHGVDIGNPLDVTVTTAPVLIVTSVKTSAYTAAMSDLIPADASAGAFTITLPHAPPARSAVLVKKVDTSANVVTVQRSGSDVFNMPGGDSAVQITLSGQSATFQYDSGVWYVLTHGTPVTSLDGRYQRIGSDIVDSNGNKILALSPIVNAVNYLKVENNSAGNTWVSLKAVGADTTIGIWMYPKGGGGLRIYTEAGQVPTLRAAGDDTNLDLRLRPKGTGGVYANDANNAIIAAFLPAGTPVNYWAMYSANAGGPVRAIALGADTDIGINLITKGTGVGQLNSSPIHSSAVVAAATAKATPVDADKLPLIDSAASNVLKSLSVGDLKALIAAYIVNGAPGALDTLDELAAALGDDANFATTITNALALKSPLASPTFTGTVAGITKAMVGLGSADNTADSAKPVSTDQLAALNTKQPIVMTGTCATAVGTAAKTVTLDAPWASYTPVAGDVFAITYTSGQTATNSTVAINGTTARNVRTANGLQTRAATTAEANAPIIYRFDGTYYRITTPAVYTEIDPADLINPAHTDTAGLTGRRAAYLKRKAIATAVTSSATPAIGMDLGDWSTIAVAHNITSITTSGTPNDLQTVKLKLVGTGSFTLSFGSSWNFGFGVAAPTAIASAKAIYVMGYWNTTTSKVDVLDVKQEA